MRSTGWILAMAMVAGSIGSASGGQPCGGCIGGAAPQQANHAFLGGEACCSPTGYAGYSALPGCCCENDQPCCNNAWDGYCEHHAKVQAFWAHVGTPKPRCRLCDFWTTRQKPCSESSRPAVPPAATGSPTVAPALAAPMASPPAPVPDEAPRRP